MLYIIYKTDNWHTCKSKVLIAIATNKSFIIPLCKTQSKKENCVLNNDQLFNIDNILQTQGYENGEFLIEEIEENTLF